MSRALIITGEDPGAPSAGGVMRLRQMVRFYRFQDMAVDLMCLHPHSARGAAYALDLAGIDRTAHVPIWSPPRGRDRARMLRLLDVMASAGGYSVVHLDRVDCPPRETETALWFYDTFDGSRGMPGSPAAYAIVFAALEHDRASLASQGAEAIRLPLGLTLTPRHRLKGPMIGWPRPLQTWRRRDWDGVLQAMASRGFSPAGGFLMGFDDGSLPAVPQLLRPVFKRLESERAGAARGSIGLGLFPGGEIGQDYAICLHLLAQGCPVLVGDQIAGGFEGRWRLPTANTPEEMARLADEWSGGAARSWLTQLAVETWAALEEDTRAMTAYVGALLTGVLSARREVSGAADLYSASTRPEIAANLPSSSRAMASSVDPPSSK